MSCHSIWTQTLTLIFFVIAFRNLHKTAFKLIFPKLLKSAKNMALHGLMEEKLPTISKLTTAASSSEAYTELYLMWKCWRLSARMREVFGLDSLRGNIRGRKKWAEWHVFSHLMELVFLCYFSPTFTLFIWRVFFFCSVPPQLFVQFCFGQTLKLVKTGKTIHALEVGLKLVEVGELQDPWF